MTQFVTLHKKSNEPEQTLEAAANSASHTGLVRSLTEHSSHSSLSGAIARHIGIEKVSYHTPGHKGRALFADGRKLESDFRKRDLTELPGLDDLSHPRGTLAEIERRASRLWRSAESVISVNGASAGLMAAILALSHRGRKFLVPRNAHRSAVSALVLTGLAPVWYEPIWDARWRVYGAVSETSVEQLLAQAHAADIAGMLVTSPTYAGAISDIEAIAAHCKRHGVPLVVDEAHGAHLLPGAPVPPSAVSLGADVTVHSLHKTLSAFTQCGMVHLSGSSLVEASRLRASLNLVQTTSPSYPLLASIEDAIELLESEGSGRLGSLAELSARARTEIESLGFEVYQSRFRTDPMHLLIRFEGSSKEELFEYLADRGIFPEAILGGGTLLMMGIGTIEEDVTQLISVLRELSCAMPTATVIAEADALSASRLEHVEQVLSPRQAFLMPSEVVAVQEAVGRIAAECVAPCPPGFPICVPGQRIASEIMNLTSLRSLRVVCEPFENVVAD